MGRPSLAAAVILILQACVAEAPLLDEKGAAVLDRALAESLAETDLPGVVALVTSRDSVLYHRAFGRMGADRPDSLSRDAIFRIHSMTKPLTSVALMMLVERGDVDLDAPVSTYLPDFADREVLVAVDTAENRPITRPASREITVRDLLRHTSGFGYSFSNYSLLELARNGGLGGRAQPIVHDPGEQWTYGMGTAVVGWVVEEVTGQSLAEFLQVEIFTPLEMSETSFDLSPSKMGRLVDDVRRVDGVLVSGPLPDSIVGEGRGDGGLLSTAEDYARFMQFVLGRGARGSTRLVSEETIERMTRDQLGGLTVTEQPGAMPELSRPFPLGAGSDGFGLGFQISTAPSADRRPAGSLSWSGLANTHF